MKVDPNALYGVVTGDIVGSTTLSPADGKRLRTTMQAAGRELRAWLGAAMPLPLDIYAGDTWQLLLTDPGRALRASLFYRAYLRAHLNNIDTRVAIAINTVNTLSDARISHGTGAAFTASGRLLTDTQAPSRMRFAAPTQHETEVWDAVLRLIDALVVRKWTARHALAVCGAARDWTQVEIGRRWQPKPIKQSSVSDHLDAAAWDVMAAACALFEQQWHQQTNTIVI